MHSWKIVRLGDIANFHKGKGLPKSQISKDGKFECIHYGELFTKYQENIIKVISKTDENHGVFLSKKNDVIMPTSDVTPRGLSTASYISKDGVILGGDVLVIRSDPTKLYGLFLAYFITANKHKVIRLVSGSTVFHLYGSDMAKLELSLPPLNDQITIANLIEVWNRYIELLDKKILLKQNAKKSLMRNLLGAKIRLPKFEDTWENVTLGDVCEIKRGGSPRPIEDYITTDPDGLNWLRIGDIEQGSRFIYSTKEKIKKEGLKKTTYVQSGDFILSNSMSFGRPYIMKIDACIHDGWLALMNISSDVNKSFLYYLLSSEIIQAKFKSISAGSGVQNLKKETVATVDVKMPSKAEQDAIAKLLHCADDEIDELQTKRKLVIQQKQYLLDSLISGRILTPESFDTKNRELVHA